jgi:hypothetical protein
MVQDVPDENADGYTADSTSPFDEGFVRLRIPATNTKGSHMEIVQRHLRYLICSTYEGCRRHIEHLSLGERWRLAHALKCDPMSLGRELWAARKAQKAAHSA